MDKESIYELQKVDCNCNDCGYMTRNMDLYNESLKTHEKWQYAAFLFERQKLINAAIEYKVKEGDLWKWEQLLNEAEKMKFQFNKKTAVISFGNCTKLDKAISFIPNTTQLDTQICFKHRKDLADEKIQS